MAWRAAHTPCSGEPQGIHIRELELAAHLERLQVEVVNVEAVVGLHEDLWNQPVGPCPCPIHVYVDVSSWRRQGEPDKFASMAVFHNLPL